MSADNWMVCPKCTADVERAIARERAKAAKLYGKVSAEEYESARAKVDAMGLPEDQHLREDYEIGMDDGGTLRIDYSCSCSCCNARFTFKHEVKAFDL